jgi:DNA-binding NtrC family response regulator
MVRTILVIEDEESLGAMLQMVLSRRGFKVLLTSSVREARAVWNALKHEIDLLIADDSLPDGSGILLALEFETERPHLRVIISSGRTHQELPGRYMTLQKPYDLQDLVRLVGAEPSQTGT